MFGENFINQTKRYLAGWFRKRRKASLILPGSLRPPKNFRIGSWRPTEEPNLELLWICPDRTGLRNFDKLGIILCRFSIIWINCPSVGNNCLLTSMHSLYHQMRSIKIDRESNEIDFIHKKSMVIYFSWMKFSRGWTEFFLIPLNLQKIKIYGKGKPKKFCIYQKFFEVKKPVMFMLLLPWIDEKYLKKANLPVLEIVSVILTYASTKWSETKSFVLPLSYFKLHGDCCLGPSQFFKSKVQTKSYSLMTS